MLKRCPVCKIDVENKLICCPKCKGELVDKSYTDQFLSDEQINRIVGIAVRKTAKTMWKRFAAALSIIAIGSFVYSGWTLDNLYKKAIHILENRLVEKIDEEFQTERIKSTVSDVAKNESKDLMNSIIKPEIKAFKDQTNSKVENFNQFIKDLETEYKEQYLVLEKEVQKLKTRNEIAKLGDRAMLRDGAEALKKLSLIVYGAKDDSLSEEAKEQQNALRAMAKSTINSIIDYYINVTYIKNFDLTIVNEQGVEIKNEHIPTDKLIGFLMHNDFKHRAKAAQLLNNRKEVQVIEALLERILNDTDIEVLKEANKSFCNLTGLHTGDIPVWPLPEYYKKYWTDNKDRLSEEFKKKK